MKRIITGILIIVLGLAFLAGIVSFVFFRVNLLAFFGFFNQRSGGTATSDDTGAQGGNGGAAATGTGQVRTIVVDDDLLDSGQDEPVDTAPVFRRAAATVKENDLLKMAAVFAERFGTYSNQSDFVNIADLSMFMSEKMKKWSDTYVAEMRSKQSGEDLYYGITTKAVNREMELLDETAGLAKITVRTRRQEAAGFTDNISESFSQEIVVNMVKENGSWKIDAAYWQ